MFHLKRVILGFIKAQLGFKILKLFLSNAYIGSDQFQCAHGKKCIDKDQVCDDVPQCQDRSDELDCSKQTEGCVHHCDNKSRCLPAKFLCDGEWDCLDGTDEASCGGLTWSENADLQEVMVFLSYCIWSLKPRCLCR